ncbi:zeta toxin family protein [Xanthomonas massiliensis]|uniref:zeta toxin family protein n=1 Tax=Xanthomonas massiliensis TaxID=1720302 RepID=UPI0008242A3E|nr:zeta toxin family protein [Xanthomonas massiliensis]
MDLIETQIAEAAIAYAKANRKRIARELTDPAIYQPEAEPVSVFMAGSPGAGKTEASIELIGRFPEWRILRIDPDELRELFPDYTGGNAWLFQRAVARVVDAVLDQAFHRRLSFVLDGTFASYEVARKNVERSLEAGRRVQILYVYQEPLLAWGFVQAREAAEGRRIEPANFIEQYFGAREVVNRLKGDLGPAIHVDLLMKNNDNSNRFYRAGVDRIDSHIPERVGRAELERLLGLA